MKKEEERGGERARAERRDRREEEERGKKKEHRRGRGEKDKKERREEEGGRDREKLYSKNKLVKIWINNTPTQNFHTQRWVERCPTKIVRCRNSNSW